MKFWDGDDEYAGRRIYVINVRKEGRSVRDRTVWGGVGESCGGMTGVRVGDG